MRADRTFQTSYLAETLLVRAVTFLVALFFVASCAAPDGGKTGSVTLALSNVARARGSRCRHAAGWGCPAGRASIRWRKCHGPIHVDTDCADPGSASALRWLDLVLRRHLHLYLARRRGCAWCQPRYRTDLHV